MLVLTNLFRPHWRPLAETPYETRGNSASTLYGDTSESRASGRIPAFRGLTALLRFTERAVSRPH
jgi:hypothetical protein